MDGKHIASKIENLIRDKGIKKVRLGEILGASKNSSKQWKHYRFTSFLNALKKGKVVLKDLNKVALALGQSSEWFLVESSMLLAQKTKDYKVRSALHESGLNESEINLLEKHIQLLKKRRK